MEKILFVGGGTLGHIYPAIPVIKKLKQKNRKITIYFIGTENGLERNILDKVKEIDHCIYQKSQGFRRKFSLYNFKTMYNYIINYYSSKKILKKYKPDIVVGMGGYVSGAVLKAALKLKIKTVVHEQNSVLGLTNNLLKNKVDKFLLSYKIDNMTENMVVVGNPRTTEYYENHKNKINNEIDNTLLVVGGSRGAKLINDIILSLKDQFIKYDIKVTLITGKKYYKENYIKIKDITCNNLIVKDFVNDLASEIINTKIVITRCGATTLSEIMALNKVSILIPSPNVTNNHQEKNGMFLSENNAALMITEKNITANKLFKMVIELMNDKEKIKQIKENLFKISIRNSTDLFINELYKL